jgi:site-specific DNA-methyltransferase (adenine-specific)
MKNKKFLNKIIHGDALEILPQLENNSIDIVLTDPPYFLDKMDKDWKHEIVSNKKNQRQVKSLPAGMKFDRQQGIKFYDWYLKISKELFRILKPGGFFFSFSSPRLYHRMASAVDDAGFEIRDCFLWLYTQNQPKAMSLSHFVDKLKINKEAKENLKKELKDWKTPQIKTCFEPIVMAQKPPEETFLANILKHQVGLFNTSVKVGNNMFPSNILVCDPINEVLDKYFLIDKPGKEEKGGFNHHLTVKPLLLCEHLIELSAFSNDAVILDPFVGSGTTAVAAKKLGKNFIGIDTNKEYIEIAIKRLKNVSIQEKLNISRT